jgi:putative aldouronate transport system permease protein
MPKAENLASRDRRSVWQQVWRMRVLYLMALPGLLWFAIFKYGPMWGVMTAFQDYSPFLGMLGSPWVGWKHFQELFARPDFWILLKNTLILGVLSLVIYFPFTIVLALLLNELRNRVFREALQTVFYAPYFVSWVVIAGITILTFSSAQGIFSRLLASDAGQPFMLLNKPEYFRLTVILQQIWKDAGWGSVIFLAALSGIDQQLYEAAVIDGASRWKQLWHITLVGLRPTIVIILIMRLGSFLDVGFEQIYTLINNNPLLYRVGDVFDTFAFRKGIQEGMFSYATTVSLFKSVIAFVLVLGANWLAKKTGEEGLF